MVSTDIVLFLSLKAKYVFFVLIFKISSNIRMLIDHIWIYVDVDELFD